MDLSVLRDDWSEMREMLDGPADRKGECDGCHVEGVFLWTDVATLGEGDFEYCAECWKRRLRALERRIRDLVPSDDECPICGLSYEANYGPFGCEQCGFGEEDD